MVSRQRHGERQVENLGRLGVAVPLLSTLYLTPADSYDHTSARDVPGTWCPTSRNWLLFVTLISSHPIAVDTHCRMQQGMVTL